MTLRTESPASYDAVVAFMQDHSGPENRYLLADVTRMRTFLANGQIFSEQCSPHR